MIAGVSLLGVVTATLASWIVERVAEEDTAQQAATAAQIDELRDEIRRLDGVVRPRYGERPVTRERRGRVIDDQANRGVGHRFRRQDGDRRDRQAPVLRAGRRRREQPRQGRPRRRRDLRPRHEPLGLDRHRRRRRADRAQARRAGALRPDRGARRRQHRADHPVPAGGHRRLLDVDDAVGVADDAPEPAELDRADHRGLRGWASRRASPPASTPASPTTCSR